MASAWNTDKLNALSSQMKKLGKDEPVKVSVSKQQYAKPSEYPDDVLYHGLADVLPPRWDSTERFESYINDILNGTQYEFSEVVLDKSTGVRNFWIVRSFVNAEGVYVHEGVEYPKKEVLSSKKFYLFLLNYCKNILNDKVHVSTFFGYYKDTEHRYLQKSLIKREDLDILEQKEFNIEDCVLILFKKRG